MRIAGLTLAVLLFAGGASAQIGPRFALSVPTGSARDAMDPGFYVGVTGYSMKTTVAGVGADIGYHHWSGSTQFNASQDQLWSLLTGSAITGSKTHFGMFEASAHLRFALPTHGPLTPWAKAGFGMYDFRSSLEVPGITDLTGAAKQSNWEIGYLAGVGIDARSSTHVRFGLEATYVAVQSRSDLGHDLTPFTVGARVLFLP